MGAFVISDILSSHSFPHLDRLKSPLLSGQKSIQIRPKPSKGGYIYILYIYIIYIYIIYLYYIYIYYIFILYIYYIILYYIILYINIIYILYYISYIYILLCYIYICYYRFHLIVFFLPYRLTGFRHSVIIKQT